MMVRALYWLDQRDPARATWHGRRGDPRPSDAVDVVCARVPERDGQLVDGNPVPDDQDSYNAGYGMVLVIGIPVHQ